MTAFQLSPQTRGKTNTGAGTPNPTVGRNLSKNEIRSCIGPEWDPRQSQTGRAPRVLCMQILIINSCSLSFSVVANPNICSLTINPRCRVLINSYLRVVVQIMRAVDVHSIVFGPLHSDRRPLRQISVTGFCCQRFPSYRLCVAVTSPRFSLGDVRYPYIDRGYECESLFPVSTEKPTLPISSFFLLLVFRWGRTPRHKCVYVCEVSNIQQWLQWS